MYLKSLSLKGFKSFADRSVLSLEPGVTAIVGPNGSGKSNISDAVLWVLGERNAKNLRGQVMEDVIFAGSSARKSVGVAEVELVLDNSDGSLPVDYTEVSIARRMFRNGESEYLINGTAARRMDVLDILHDSGMGTGTYSIISQGNLDAILQSKPEDRRALIEEAAGVLKHKQRKEKSERRIEQMEQHLERVQDIVNEVSRQLGPLERKAKKAAAYQGLSEQLSDVDLRLAVDDVRVLRRQWDAVSAQIAQVEELLGQKKEEIDAREADSNRFQELIRHGSESVADLARQHRSISEHVERFDSQRMLYEEKLRMAGVRRAELDAQIASNAARRAQLMTENDDLNTQLAEVAEKLALAQESAAKLEKGHASVAQELASLERQLSEHLELRRNAEKEEQTVRRTHTQTKEKLDMALSRARLIDERMTGLHEAYTAAAADEQAKQAAIAQHDEQSQRAQQNNDAAREAFNRARALEDGAKAALEEASKQQRALSAQILALEEVERQTLSANSAARAWLDDDKTQDTFGLSPLLHQMKVEEGYELVVERILAASVSALLVDDASAALSVTKGVSDKNLAGSVVLLLRHDSADCRAVRDAAYEGDALLSHISCSDQVKNAISALFANVYVCKDLPSALQAHEACTSALCFATQQGELVLPDGRVMFGADEAQAARGAVARSRRLDALRAEHRQASIELDRSNDAVQQAARAVKDCQDALLEAGQVLARLRGEASAAKSEWEAAQKRTKKAQQEYQSAQAQRVDIQKTIDSATPQVCELAEKLEQVAAVLEQEKGHVAAAQDALAPAREKESQAAHDLADAKLKEAMLRERQVYLERVLKTRGDELQKLDDSDQRAHEGMVLQQRISRRLVPLLETLAHLEASARARVQVLEGASAAQQDAAADMHVKAQEALTAVRAARDAFDEANGRLGELRVEKGRLEVQVESAVLVIARDFAMPIEQALELPALEDRASLEEESFRLKKRIANMGTINPDAATEYEALKLRFDYLSSQLDDLRAARSALRKINAAIDKRMKDDFARTFEQANANFKEIFASLFPGGTAELVLVDPNDMENTGVEVVAQPRGKKISKMTLMSGGEKSLVALALLFAVYKIRSTPFYILDEVEAALDDSNLRRLIAYLNELRAQTQLIMITHQRRTMEMADVLFGVSMQADGVTKVISQRLEHALQYAE